ncbi:MAG: hypothetical protein QOI07_113 [Verrucomicrobiota bacterium]
MRPGVSKPIARIRLEPEEITQRVNLSFESAHDDLDELQIASFSTQSGRQFTLVRHRYQPIPGTDILTHERSTTLSEDLVDALAALSLKTDDLTWKHPDINETLLANLGATLPREEALKKLYDLQNDLQSSVERLSGYAAPSLVITFLTNAGAYVSTHLGRLREWGSQNDLSDLDLIGYSTWCIFEVDRMLGYYRGEVPLPSADLGSPWHLDSRLHELQSRIVPHLTTFDQHLLQSSRRIWDYRILEEAKLVSQGPVEEYAYLQSLYERYAHAGSYWLVPHHAAQSLYVRDVFLDRAVRLAERCVLVINIFVRTASETPR